MNTREGYLKKLNLTYAEELDYLRKRFDTAAEIVNTGGGCMAIEVDIPSPLAGDQRSLQVLITTEDNGMADDRAEILHWYVCLIDAADTDEPLADGHDLDSCDAACDDALARLRDNISSLRGACSCLLASEPGLLTPPFANCRESCLSAVRDFLTSAAGTMLFGGAFFPPFVDAVPGHWPMRCS